MYRLSKNNGGSCLLRKTTLICGILIGLLQSSAAVEGQSSTPDAPSGLFWGTISYYVGGGTLSFSNGVPATGLTSLQSYAVAVDSQGNVYLQTGSQAGGNNIYMVYAGGAKIPPLLSAVTSSPVAGGIYEVAGANVQCTGAAPSLCQDASTALQATFGYIAAMAFDANDNLYIADEDASAIRRIDYASTAVTTVAGQLNNPTPFGSLDVGDSGPATSATLFFESDVAVDAAGNLFIADGNNEVRVVYQGGAVPATLSAEEITPQKGYVYRIAGSTGQYCAGPGMCGVNAPALSASFGYVTGVAVDGAGNLYVADFGAEVIDLVYAGGSVPSLLKPVASAPVGGNIYEIAGQEFTTCSTAPCGDGGPATQAQFNSPYHLHVDQGGNLYLQDQLDYTVRKIDESGYISLSAGTESPNNPAAVSTGNGGPASSAQFQAVSDFAVDSQNALYVLDQQYVWRAVAATPQIIDFPAFTPATYGAAPITLNAFAKNGQGTPTGLPITYSATGPATISTDDLVITGAGVIHVTATQAGNGQYAPASVTQTLTVSKATLTVTANNASKIFGAPNPAFTANFNGFVNGDTRQSAVTGQPAFSTTAMTSSHYGTYPITVSQGSLAAGNYNFTFVPGTLTVSGATPQTISFAALPPVNYGDRSTLPLTATASSGLPVQYTVNSGPGVVSGSTLTVMGGGDIVITANQPGNDTYAAASPITQTLTIYPALLTVTGPIFSLPYGTIINPATFPAATITGFVNGNTAGLVTGSPQYATSASGTPQAGSSYPVQVSKGTLALVPGAAADYVLSSFHPGTLTIVPAPQTIVFDQLTNSVYGGFVTVHAVVKDSQGNPIAQPVTVTATSPGIFADYHSSTVVLTSSISTANLSSTGAGTVTVTAMQAGTTDYSAAQPVSQTITFAKAPLNVTATSFTREFGADNPILTYQLGCPNGVAQWLLCQQ